MKLRIVNVLSLYKKGTTIKALGKRYSRRPSHISKILNDAGIDTKLARATRTGVAMKGVPKSRVLGGTLLLTDRSMEIISYIAGFFDGEGCIQRSLKYDHFRISFSQNGTAIHKWLKRQIGVGVYAPASPYMGHYQYRISAQWQVFLFLKIMKPHLKIKRQQAVKALSWYKSHYGWV